MNFVMSLLALTAWSASRCLDGFESQKFEICRTTGFLRFLCLSKLCTVEEIQISELRTISEVLGGTRLRLRAFWAGQDLKILGILGLAR